MPRPLDRVPFIQCEWLDRCNSHAYVVIKLGGHHARLKEPVKVCRTHVKYAIEAYTEISNHVHVRSTRP